MAHERIQAQRGSVPVVQVKAVLFDFDGTLTLPGHLDFAAVREAIGCPPGGSLLGYLDSIQDAGERDRAAETLDRFEREAAERAVEDPDAATVVQFCRERGLRLGIITRNSRASLDRSFARFQDLRRRDFDVIITRDDPLEVKPAPDGVEEACRRLGTVAAESFVVGDFLYDIEAGRRAGAITVFYDSHPERSFERPECDYSIGRLGELPFLLSLHLPLPAGKVPNDMLARFLAGNAVPERTAPEAGADTPFGAAVNEAAVLVGPGVGEDVAALAPFAPGDRGTEGERDDVLLLKSDPITFVSEDFGHYLLTVNANDIATAGGTPRWLLATLLAPPGILAVEIGRMFRDLAASCRRAGVVLCGGHTELTAAVTRPVVSGTMVGTVAAGRLVRKQGMQTGDLVLLTKGVAVEGTAILATAYRHRLIENGVEIESIDRAAALAERMSILPEARIAREVEGTASMHDVTEGGIATALREVAAAGGHRLRIELDRIPILPETALFCAALDLDPLGLIGSGSLLICVRRAAADLLQKRLRRAGIAVESIGEVLEEGEGIVARRSNESVPMPNFAADELTRLP